ncbi:MAG: glycosyl hydrolase family 18 protein [Chloroflexota bacterium]
MKSRGGWCNYKRAPANEKVQSLIFTYFCVMATLLIGAVGIRAQGDTPSWCVSVWYPSADTGGLESIRANADQIGMIHPFWYSQRPDGTLQVTDDAEAADLLAEWRGDGMKIVPSIAGAVWEMITAPDMRAFHIDQIMALVERMGYDGIDIDYEGFPLFTRDDFSTFVEELSARLHENGKLLTIAVHAKTNDTGAHEGAAAQDWTRIAPAVDVLTIMTYNYTSRNEPPGPISPPEWVDDVLVYAATVTDLGKVQMGLHIFAYSWLRDKPPATTTTWEAAQRLIDIYDLEITRNPANMEAMITFKARGLPRQTITFADSAGLEYKLEMILADFPDLGGAAIWGVGGEDPDIWNVLREARQPNCTLRTAA